MSSFHAILRRLLTALFICALLTGAVGVLPARADSTPTYSLVRVGFWRACGITPAGGLRCWGYNASGELGDGTTLNRATAVDVTGLTSGVVDVAMGTHHTCALTTAGAVYCWGWNYYGQLGNGTTTSSPVPVLVSGMSSGIRAISSNGHHTCAIAYTGNRLYCWGRNDTGQVGNNTRTTSVNTPQTVLGVSKGVKSVAGGFAHTCAITVLNQFVCWGKNFSGQLGFPVDGLPYALAPIYVTTYHDAIRSVSAGYDHTCAVNTSGGVKCWGGGGYGQLGNGSADNNSNPVDAAGLTSGVSQVSAGWWQTCARLDSGEVSCWGINDYGQDGDGSTINRASPASVQALPGDNAAMVSSGFRESCAAGDSGWIRCWGDGGFGQLDNGLTLQRSHPRDTAGLSQGSLSLSTGYGHVCAVDAAGTARCWGNNNFGQAGGGAIKLAVPQAVTGAYTQITASDAGHYDDPPAHTCALTPGGGVVCWGNNSTGQLGDGTTTTRSDPQPVSGLTSGVSAISAGKQHTCALLDTGAVQCWGDNSAGQLDDGTTTPRSTPVAVSSLSGVTAISAGALHTCALLATGTVKCWGDNSAGQLGDGTTTPRSTPVTVSGVSGAVDVSAGGGHTCAVVSGETVSCWGNNSSGQLGNGSLSAQSEMEPLPGGLEDGEGIPEGCALLPGGGFTCAADSGIQSADLGLAASNVSGLGAPALSVSAGNAHTCALLQGGAVKCWGVNKMGQLGDGSMTNRTAAVQVLGLEGHIAAVSAGGEMTCAAAEDGRVKCWGGDDFSQLGLGSTTYHALPETPHESAPVTRVISSAWTGAAGSVFTVTGENFPQGTINLQTGSGPLPGSVPVSAEGSWVAYLTSDAAGEGMYDVTANGSGGGNGQTAVYIQSAAAVQPAEGWGAVFALPALADWMPAAWLWIPLVSR